MSDPVGEFLEMVRIWGNETRDISAVILVGSHARGEARPDSDIDLVIISNSPDDYFHDQSWLTEFGNPIEKQSEDWGLVQSLRVWYESGLEVEFGFSSKVWLTEPLDEGTRNVLENGYQYIINKNNYPPNCGDKYGG